MMIGRLWLRIPPVAVDSVVAVVFTVLAQVELHVKADDGYPVGPLVLNVPLQLMFTSLLVLRSTWPRLTLALMCTWMILPNLAVAHTILFWGDFLPLLLVNYTVARAVPGWLGRWSWLVCLASLLTFALRVPELRTVDQIAFPLVLFAASSVLGRLVRRLSLQRAALGAALVELSSNQAEREDAAAAAERRRIAAEMHDVISHSVSLMTLQTGAARLHMESTGLPVPDQLRGAEETGRRALTELRRALQVMRGPDEHAALAPLPDLNSIPELLSEMRQAGLEVDISQALTEGIPASIQLAVYRILQESLTNVIKHAGPVPVSVAISSDQAQVVVEVRNAAGRTAPLPTGGHGLGGMRERVAMFAGSLDTRVLPDSGFLVRAALPLKAEKEVRSV